ncbi:MAG: hypothetical protein KKG00_02715, partial [Bacteroidetes bacterium]|nr:hypothetical protein [Bacteroidota bacterium]
LIHPNFRLMAGYDHLRRQELRLQTRNSLEGISFGAWLRVKQFEFGYGRAQYTPGLAMHTFSAHVQFLKQHP